MGIPSYFSYIVKNHIKIIRRFNRKTQKVSNLYMDCNSIVYDSVRSIDFSAVSPENTNRVISKAVITKIEEYISIIAPTQNVMIAFDGVAPVAKMDQQRTRRYKSWYQTQMTSTLTHVQEKRPQEHRPQPEEKRVQEPWNTTAITPGTAFMRELNHHVQIHFSDKNRRTTYRKMILSTSDEVGEGEHKIFQYIRSHSHEHAEDSTTVIYGLDADLIMLSINHLPVSPNTHLFRETPEFIKSIDNSLEPNETYLMDIPELSRAIMSDMNNETFSSTSKKSDNKHETVNRVYDYIFLCFFLGNDFMPHFPAVNIRTGGIEKMLSAYKSTLGGTSEFITDGTTIHWKNVRKVVAFLAEREEEYLKAEMKLREKKGRYYYPTDTVEQRLAKFEATPMIERAAEQYINPSMDGWEARYYKTLHKVDVSDTGTCVDDLRVKQISVNFLEGLEWTMKYYTLGCVDWRWSYHYHYPPLLKDLLKHIPYFEHEFVAPKAMNPVSPYVQLCYVLPHASLHFLPANIAARLDKEKYPLDARFVWSFNKYFWESHVDLPEIDIDELERMVTYTESEI